MCVCSSLCVYLRGVYLRGVCVCVCVFVLYVNVCVSVSRKVSKPMFTQLRLRLAHTTLNSAAVARKHTAYRWLHGYQ